MRSVEEVGRGGRVDLGIKLCVFFVVLLCVCVRRSGRPWYQAFQKFSLGQSQARGSARLGSARLVSPRLISKISQIKKKVGGTAATHGRVVVGLGGRSRRSVEEVGSTLVSSFSKTQSRSVSGERQPDSARSLGSGSARLVSSRLISKISQIKKKGRWYCGNALARRCRFRRSVEEVGRGGRVDLGIKLFKNSVSVSLRREARLGSTRLGSAWLGSSRLGSSRLISKISQIKKKVGGTAATHWRVVVGL